ncbi:MAG: hypothetical protein M3R65_11695 [Gemmatimonadota bacterium]|nr:hypothetical protein [Gemmatimonadota bacterium]
MATLAIPREVAEPGFVISGFAIAAGAGVAAGAAMVAAPLMPPCREQAPRPPFDIVPSVQLTVALAILPDLGATVALAFALALALALAAAVFAASTPP